MARETTRKTASEVWQEAKNEQFAQDVKKVNSDYLAMYDKAVSGFVNNSRKNSPYDPYRSRSLAQEALSDIAYREQVIEAYYEKNRRRLGEDQYSAGLRKLASNRSSAQNVMGAYNAAAAFYPQQQKVDDYLERAMSYYNSAQTDLDSMTWANASDVYGRRSSAADALKAENDDFLEWLEKNRVTLGEQNYNSLKQQFEDIGSGYDDVVSAFGNNADLYGQFATEDDYLKWDAYSTPEKRQATYQKNMDRLEVLREERRTIQGRVNTYRAGTNPYASGGSSDYKSDIQKLDAIDKEINALEEEISMSEDYERSARYADYMQKYSGKSYNELLSLLPDIKDEEEREWVSQYALSVMTVLDYNSSIEKAAVEIDSLEKVINEYNSITAGYGMGGDEEDKKINSKAAQFLNSHGFRNIKEAEIRLEELKTTQWDLSNRKKYAFLDTNQDFDTIAGDIADSRTAGFGIGFGTNWWGFGDPVYDYINDIDGTRKEYVDTSDVQHPYTIYDMMYDDEIMKYNYLYNTEGKDSADKYLDYLEYTLNERRMGIARGNAAILAKKHPFAASALSVPYNLVSGIGFADIAGQNLLKNIAEGLTGEYIPVDYNSGAMGATVFNSTVRGTVAQNIANKYGVIELDKQAHPILSKVFNGKSLGDVYLLGMSMADSATTALLAPVIGTGATALLGGSAASQGVLDAVSRGATDEQALMMGIVNGACEMFFEKYSLEQLLKGDTRNIVMAFLKQGFAEGSEEFNTTVANNLADIFIMAKNSGYQRNVDKYIDQGLSPEEAEKMAFWDAAIQAGWDFVGGFASGGIMGSVSTRIQNYQNQNAEAFRIYGADPGALVSEALEIDPDNAYAQKMQNRLEAGKQLSGGQLNRLVKQNEAALFAQDISAIQSATESRLAELGETGDVSSIAAALTKQAAGRKLTRAEQKVIENSEHGQPVANELNTDNIQSGEVSSAWVKNIGTNRINAQEYNRPAEAAQLPQKAVKNTGDSKMLSPKATTVEAPAETVPANRDSADDIDGLETTYPVSEDGKAHLISNPEQSMDIVGFDSIKNGKAMLRTSDGEVVPADDVSYANESQAIVFETIASMGIPAKSANILLQGFLGKEGIDAEAYARGLLEAFEYGKANRNTSGMSFSSALTPAQLDYVYRQGRKAAKKQTGREQARMIQTVERARAVIDQRGDSANAEYTVILEDGLTEEEMTPSQKASYEIIRHIPAAMKGNVRIYDGKTGEFGYYDPESGDIYLNINSTRSQKSMMAFTMGHELVHRAKDGSPAKYRKFADFLIEQYGKQGSDVEAMIAEQKQAAKDHRLELTEEQAFDEVVADACQRMLLDTNAGQRLAEFGVQSKQNQSIVQDVIQWIRDILEKLRNIFADVDPDSLAAQEFAKFDAGVKQILADMYVDMTIDAGENLSVIKKAFGSNTQVKTNENGEFTMAQNQDGSQKIFNLATWENGGRETLEATLRREGYTQDEIDAALKIMDAKQEMVTKIGNELDGNGRLAFPEQGRINEATLTTDIKDGHAVLSALVSNGDYPVNIDLLMVCKKRKAYQRVINRLCDTGMIKQATVDAMAIAEINKILGNHGFETACLGCFVESRRLRIQEWAQTIVKEWNGEVKKRDHNAKPFGFGKGEAKLTPDEVMQLIGELETSGPKNDKGNLNLGQGSAVKRMGVLLDKVPSLRRTLTVEDLITPEGLSSLRRFDSNLFSMVKSRYGSNSPKFVQEFNPYNHELAKYGKVPSQYKNLREYLYAIGGARMQSFSDFIVENWFDYCQIVADLAARKLPMHTYTKEIAMVKLFGMTGIKINMSLIPDVDRSLGKEYAGLTRNAQGELELIWADNDRNKATGGQSYMQSINAREAFELQNDPRYSANIGTIAIGISDRQIRMMLNDSRIRMVIPYHASGMNPIFADMMGTSFYKNYTDFQNTTIKQIYNSKGQPATLKLSKPQVAQLTGGFQFNEVLQEKGDARAAADAYKAWCSDSSLHTITIKGETYTAELTPKFNDFADEANYYKLLEDFNTYDCITEQAAPQGAVQQIYPEGFEDILRAELSGQERYRQKQEKNQAFDKAMAEIESYLSKHTKADTVYYAQQQNIKLSKKDSKLDAADKERLKQLQEQGVSFKLPVNEDTSPRALLTNALDSVITDPVEKQKLQEYRENIENLNEQEAKLRELKSQIKDLSFAPGPRDTQKIKALREEAAKTENRINIYDNRLLRFEASSTLQNVLQREKAKVAEREKAKRIKGKEDYQRGEEVKLAELIRKYRATREALTQQKLDTTTMEAEFIRLVKQYEKLSAKSNASNKTSKDKLSDLRTALKEEAKAHKDDQKQWEKEFDRLLKEYEHSEKRIDLLEAKIKAQRKSASARVDSRNRTEMRKKIRRVIRDLDKLLNRGTKKQNVKEGMRDFVAAALASAEALFTETYTTEDMISYGVKTDTTAEERKLLAMAKRILDQISNLPKVADVDDVNALMKQETDLKKELSVVKSRLKGVFERERYRLSGFTASKLFEELANSYANLAKAGDNYIRGAYREEVYQRLLETQTAIGAVRVADMSLEQLAMVYDSYAMVLQAVRDANKMFVFGRNVTRDDLARSVLSELKNAIKAKKNISKAGKLLNSFAWNNLKPIYAFERIGSSTLAELYANIRKGQDVWALDMMEADEFRRSMYDKYHRKGWDMDKKYTFKSSTGLEFSLNLEQIMSLYAYSKRAQAHDHLLKGGIVFDGETEVTETKNGIRRTYLVEDATTYKISVETLADIVGTLDSDQKAFVDEMQGYLSTTMGNKGNQVSMKMYGINLFKEKFYFPLRSAEQFTEKAREADLQREQGQISLANSGFTQSTTPNASDPVVLSGFMDVWSGHVNNMSNYHAFVLPLEDFRRVYNYKTANIEGQDSESVYQAIQNAHGTAATAYIDQLYRDLNGGVVADPRENIAKKMIGLFKQGAVMASSSVVIQQPSALVRSFAMIDPKYFGALPITRGASRVLTDRVHHQHEQLWKELKKYAPVAMIKEMGYFDTGMGRSAVDFLQTEEYHGFGEKAKGFFADSDYRGEILSKAAAKADELTWIQIWNAVKNETAARNPDMNRNSEVFLKIAGERFSEVIDRTQVYDSVFARSGNMRSKSVFMNIATAFMAEPTTSINMIEDAIRKFGKGYKGQAARTIGAVFLNILLNSALVSLIYAARDDDEDETYLEKYVSSFVTESMDGLNPMTYYPFLKDVWSILQGYDVERADLSLVTDVVDVMKNLVKLHAKDTSGMEEEELAEHNKQIRDAWLKALDGMTAFMGLPVKNVRRDFNGAINMYKTLSADFGGRTTTIRSLGDVLQSDVSRTIPVFGWLPQEKKEDKLFDALVAGDTAYVERLKSTYKDEKAYQSAIRSVIGDRFVKGKIGADKASSYLVLHGGLDASQARGYIEEWTMEIDVGIVYDDLRKQYVDNKFTESDAIDYLVKYGGKREEDAEKTVREWSLERDTGIPYSKMKEVFLDRGISEDEAIEYMIEYGGKRRDAAEETVNKWRLELETGIAYEEMKTKFIDEDISESEAVDYMVEYGGKKQKDAEAIVKQWTFEKETGIAYDDMKTAFIDEKITESEAVKYRVEYGGAKQEDAEKTVSLWKFESENGWDYDNRRSLYLDGEISAATLKKALIKYGDMEPEDADLQVQAYNWEAEGYENVTTAAVRDYNEYCAASNVPKDIYMHIRKFANSTENDVVNGEKVPYSAVKKIMREINSQTGLTSAQKTAIARSIGWKDSTIEKYKLW